MIVVWITMGMGNDIGALGSCGGCRVFLHLVLQIFSTEDAHKIAVRTFGQVVWYNYNKYKYKYMCILIETNLKSTIKLTLCHKYVII